MMISKPLSGTSKKGRFNVSVNGSQPVGFQEFYEAEKFIQEIAAGWYFNGIMILEILEETDKFLTGHEIIRAYDKNWNWISCEIFNNGSIMYEV